MFTMLNGPCALTVDFPWSQKVFIRVTMENSATGEYRVFERPISNDTWKNYYRYVDMAKAVLDRILQ